ncbi:molybdenum cofactor guanylyltransferase MobA [Algiphilus sp. W345]|uniref:Molybdenum cofactor guanylyltransferase n=1 Tax=Banduia mediterranea TaxID=3075609 RepID=A0ABU2WJP7_9GAMM|nr:molybdenum cofactor guanylyltransferase MobA [Algiphilus sp. W345]MDT0498095.1 molybdenum cofactor guanylyltransferase MobA [Algiphilus sp. W345]
MNIDPTLRESVTGAVLAGGRGLRVGGRDKGLILWRGRPLAEQVAAVLAPQVATLLISANRNLERYRAYGFTVVSDEGDGDYQGPLAGMLAVAGAADTRWIVCAPCDVPQLPPNLVSRLIGAARDARVAAAYAVCGDALYPLCVFERALIASLNEAATRNDRSVRGFLQRNNAARADFSDCGLRNLNTPQALEAA